MTTQMTKPLIKYKCCKCGKHYVEDDIYLLLIGKRDEYWCHNCGNKKSMTLYYKPPQFNSIPINNPNQPEPQQQHQQQTKPQQKHIDKAMKGIPHELRDEVLKILNDAR